MIVKEQSPMAQTAQTATPATGKRAKGRLALLAVAAALLIWVGIDLFAPRTTNLRKFDANEVARLETAMWRSYYQKERLKLFNQMTELLRTQYNLPVIRSQAVGYQAARAAFVFKEGHNRADYEKALPYLVSYYQALHKVSDIDFDVNKAAALELEWWIIHRERKSHAPGDLARSLAELPAAIYNLPVERFMEHARLRAEAMTIRDDQEEKGGVSEADWAKIGELLRDSWQSLLTAVSEV